MAFTLTFVKIFAWALYLLAPVLIFLGAIVLTLGQIVTHLEKWNKYDGLYWSLITATTVGYGDIRPLKKTSKALSVLIALVGMMFTGLVIAITLQATTTALEKHLDPMSIEKIKDRLN